MRQDSYQTQVWRGPHDLASSLLWLLTGPALEGWCCRSPHRSLPVVITDMRTSHLTVYQIHSKSVG